MDLRDGAAITLVGEGQGNTGISVASGGDINGDSIPDALIGDCSPPLGKAAGSVYVLFGQRDQTTVRVSEIGPVAGHGFRIDGAAPGDRGCAVASAGDVNGDGLDDIIVASREAVAAKRRLAGTAYVVFGKTSTTNVDLALFDAGAQGEMGFRIDGPSAFALLQNVDGVGDMNDDGFDDVVVGAPFAGAAYVVFGKDTTEPVDLATFDAGQQDNRGFRIEAPQPTWDDGYAVAGLGDVNGDGRPDVGLGVVRERARGRVFVVFGKSSRGKVDVRKLGPRGFRILGPRRGDAVGSDVSTGGDVNGDGLHDIVIGAPFFLSDRGWPSVFVIFGKGNASDVRMDQLGGTGFRIKAPRANESSFGMDVGAAGDHNGDGLDDIVIGAPLASPAAREEAGVSFVVLGKRGNRTIHLGRSRRAYRIIGAEPHDAAGYVAGLPDMNGDGVPEILVGAPNWDGGPGHAYIVWGRR